MSWGHRRSSAAAGFAVAVAVAIAAVASSPRTAQAAFIFTKIADSTSPLIGNAITKSPAINSSGVVAFEARMDSLELGVFKGSGGAITLIVDTSGPWGDFRAAPTIDASGKVLVSARSDPNPNFTDALLVGDGTTLTTPYVQGGGDIAGLNGGAVVRNGQIAFVGNLASAGSERILRGSISGGPVTTVGMNAAPYQFAHVYGRQLTMNDGGVVALTAPMTPSPDDAVFRTNVGFSDVVDSSGGPVASFSPMVAINNAGLVAYSTIGDDGVGLVYTSANDLLRTKTRIADSTGSFSRFGTPALNDAGLVAFWAELDAVGNSGIYIGGDPIRDKVIKTGDPLFGSTVTNFYGTDLPNALNNSGQLAFAAMLANGQLVVARAQIPEPAGAAMLAAVGGPMLLRRRWRRRYRRGCAA